MKKVLIKYILIIAIAITTFIGTGCNKKNNGGQRTMLSATEMINIANEFLISKSFSLNEWDVHFDNNNKMWAETLEEISAEIPEYRSQYRKMLAGKDYQAILYTPDQNNLTAGVCFVFIDRTSGEVIGFSAGL